jgi:hypothetical protein
LLLQDLENIATMGFIDASQQLQGFAAQNQKQTRSKRKEQPVLPDPFTRNKPRLHRQGSEGLNVDVEAILGTQLLWPGDSEHCQRVQQLHRSWQERRAANSSSLQQYEAYQEAYDQLKQRQMIIKLLSDRMTTALQRHSCCSVLKGAGADTCIAVSSSRPVACHALGTNFWLAVPTVTCKRCDDTWEVLAADVGCFGNTPVQPTHWFDKQMLIMYRELALGDGTSTHAYAGASNVACAVISAADAAAVSPALPAGHDPVPSINAK